MTEKTQKLLEKDVNDLYVICLTLSNDDELLKKINLKDLDEINLLLSSSRSLLASIIHQIDPFYLRKNNKEHLLEGNFFGKAFILFEQVKKKILEEIRKITFLVFLFLALILLIKLL